MRVANGTYVNQVKASIQTGRTNVRKTVLEFLEKPTLIGPATSPLLNGVWEVVYNGGYGEPNLLASPTRQAALFLYAGGYTPGSFGLQLARLLPNSFMQVGSECTCGNTIGSPFKHWHDDGRELKTHLETSPPFSTN